MGTEYGVDPAAGEVAVLGGGTFAGDEPGPGELACCPETRSLFCLSHHKASLLPASLSGFCNKAGKPALFWRV